MFSLRRPIQFGIFLVLLGVFIGTYFNIYSFIPYFDKVLHTLGGLIVAWFFSIYFEKELASTSKWKKVLILTAMAALIGLVWEFAEYSAIYVKNYLPLVYEYFHGGSLTDTLTDLVSDVTGGFLFSFFSKK
jgi:hypothetical protein